MQATCDCRYQWVRRWAICDRVWNFNGKRRYNCGFNPQKPEVDKRALPRMGNPPVRERSGGGKAAGRRPRAEMKPGSVAGGEDSTRSG